MYTTFRISSPVKIEFKDHSKHIHNKSRHYHTIKFIGENGDIVELELFFSCNLRTRLMVEDMKNESGRGPYILPALDGCVDPHECNYEHVFVDWHYEDDEKIVLDKCWYEGKDEMMPITEEQCEAIIDQIYSWELSR